MGAHPPLERALAALREVSEELSLEAWIVGGFVRDSLLGRPQPDLDLVVVGDASALAARFAQSVGAAPPIVFARFGTAQVTWEGLHFEFATAREESYPVDSRKPHVRPVGIEADLRRRDFTVNALLMDFDGHVVDRAGGLKDLERRRLRTPRDADQTFADDPLRMLRAARLAAQLDFELDPSLVPAMRRQRDRLAPPILSMERAGDELRKMLVSPRPRLALEILDQGGLLEVLLPELAACRGVAQGGYHVADVFAHSLLALEQTSSDLELRLAALLHDVGKPATRADDGSFHTHEMVGAELARARLLHLRFSNRQADRVARLIALHLRPAYYRPEWSDGAVRRLARDAGELILPLLDLARADVGASSYPHAEWIDELRERTRRLLGERPSRLSPPITGADVMRLRGLTPGPEVGRLKARLMELVLDGELEPERDAILAHLAAHPEL
ncbi:MAG TPA: HD domain-containing protein [Candidatus Nitrosotalea sp.]|nr:HD domain-containing protein [Candidatus Nitrosotalea sp.]